MPAALRCTPRPATLVVRDFTAVHCNGNNQDALYIAGELSRRHHGIKRKTSALQHAYTIQAVHHWSTETSSANPPGYGIDKRV